MSQVKDNDTVKVHYTGKLSSGEVFDSSEKRDPLQFQVGAGQVIPGFEEALLGMEVSEKKTVTIPSDMAYGPVREELIMEVKKEALPNDFTPEIGSELEAEGDNGQKFVVRVIEILNEAVKIDANHPLAGEDLTFELELVEIV